MKHLNLLTSCLLFVLVTHSQISSSPTTTPGAIITSLSGSNVTITGLTIQGNGSAQLANALGTFTGGKTNLGFPNIGLESGFVITTGSTTNINGTGSTLKGPNTINAGVTASAAADADADLAQVTSLSKFDLKFITFTIVPTSPVLTGTIVFGSEEYPQYVGSEYNDASAIIIDGPGIIANGTYTDLDGNPATQSRNLAVFANSSPLAINQVNGGVAGGSEDGAPINTTNAEFYVRNYTNTDDAAATGLEGTLPNLQPNGFTKPMTFRIAVTPGQSYRMKIVIADVGDGTYDSELFFKLLSSNSGQRDFGDLPVLYNSNDQQVVSDNATTLGVLGFQPAASHVIPDGTVNLYLGTNPPNAETTGQPSATASADATDEGGISFTNLDPSSTTFTATIPYYNNTGVTATITAWMDVDRNGMFSPAEGRTTTTTVTNGAGTATLQFNGFGLLTLADQYFLRFRISTEAITTVDVGGEFIDGEVEDYMTTVNVPLPVTFAGFTATAQDCGVMLKWKTASESNSEVYVVEWSGDGTMFSETATLPSKNNAEGAEYRYTLAAVGAPINYFRIRAVDFDRRFEYSSTVTLANPCPQSSSITITPNPAGAVLNIKGLKATDHVLLLNMAGGSIDIRQKLSGSGVLNTSGLVKGVYLLKVVHADGGITVLRFVRS